LAKMVANKNDTFSSLF